jgi:hypothetical protein
MSRAASSWVARASRPSNPASRRISSANAGYGWAQGRQTIVAVLLVSVATPETTGWKPVPPSNCFSPASLNLVTWLLGCS